MKEPEWVLRDTVLLLHEQSLAEHGGSPGIRDEGLLDSALGKPHNLFSYGNPAIFDLAASYVFGLVKNHPFLDGNKRTGFVVGVLFLQLNGYYLTAPEADAAIRTLALAAGDMKESAYAAWLESNSTRLK
ncbi:MAG: type II toxin-antitoxin system death-on-curing family toxin [Prosthecobacter sp.]|uniref:type II toxin-antitoxin system death-on-curing family toxin n=1 Tax=Prosthecobacter sp. TaxID=1965333 RepID=UPI003903D466